jgi:hypothetical protein
MKYYARLWDDLVPKLIAGAVGTEFMHEVESTACQTAKVGKFREGRTVVFADKGNRNDGLGPTVAHCRNLSEVCRHVG